MRVRAFLLSLCLVLLSGCYGYSIRSSAAGDGVMHRGRGSALFWGLKSVNRNAHQCLHGMAYARTYQPAWSFIVALLTAGIVTPWRSNYECVRDPNAVGQDGVFTPATPAGFIVPTQQPPGVFVPAQQPPPVQ